MTDTEMLDKMAESLHFLTDEWRGDPEWIAEERALLAEYDARAVKSDA